MAINIAQMLGQRSTDSGSYTPQDVARRRLLAERLRGNTVQDAGALGAIANTLSGSLAGYEDTQAAQIESEGQNAARERLIAALNDPGGGVAGLAAVASDPFLNENNSRIASTLLGQKIQQQDPAYQLDLAYKQAQLDALSNPPPRDPTSAIQNYEYLVSQGIDPAQAQEMSFGGGGTTINNMGNIPAGYQLITDPASGAQSMAPIPGSPAAMEAEAAALRKQAQGAGRDTVTDTIVSGAQNVRDAAQGFGATGVGNFLTGGAGFTPAGNLNEYVKSLKAIAASENINAMRQASPTGGALGNTSDADLRLLENKAGALNPQSPDFLRQVDDYERTLLRIVHGYEAGDAIYEATRPQGAGVDSSVDDILKGYGL